MKPPTSKIVLLVSKTAFILILKEPVFKFGTYLQVMQGDGHVERAVVARQLRLARPHVAEDAPAPRGPRHARQDQLQALEPSVTYIELIIIRHLQPSLSHCWIYASHLLCHLP